MSTAKQSLFILEVEVHRAKENYNTDKDRGRQPQEFILHVPWVYPQITLLSNLTDSSCCFCVYCFLTQIFLGYSCDSQKGVVQLLKLQQNKIKMQLLFHLIFCNKCIIIQKYQQL